jgi:hypothetical protein
MLTNTLQLNQSDVQDRSSQLKRDWISKARRRHQRWRHLRDCVRDSRSKECLSECRLQQRDLWAEGENRNRGDQYGNELLDLCTSDTHKLAARNLTNSGYFALGEQSDPNTIIDCIKKLIRMAEDRLARCDLQIARFKSDVPLVGEEALDEFATLTKNSISMVKRYGKGMLPVFLLLLTITLFY